MKIFIKQSGQEVPVNELSESAALKLGWKPKDEPKTEADEFNDAESEEAPREKRKYTRRNV